MFKGLLGVLLLTASSVAGCSSTVSLSVTLSNLVFNFLIRESLVDSKSLIRALILLTSSSVSWYAPPSPEYWWIKPRVNILFSLLILSFTCSV